MADSNIFQVIAEKVRETVENPPDYLPPLPDVDPGNQLDAIDDAADQITSADNMLEWLNGVDSFKDALDDLAGTLFNGTPKQARDNLFARFIFTNLPRIGATLVVLGIITTDQTADPSMTYVVDWIKLRDFLLDPETLVNEQNWEDLFADIGQPNSGRLPSILAGLIIMAPQVIIALARGDLKVAPLPPPPVRVDPGSDWAQFRSVSEDWISATLPLGDPLKDVDDPADPRYPANKHQHEPDMEPDLSASLAIRSKRRLIGGGDTGTDFEMWLGFGIDTDMWEYEPWETWFLRMVPGITAGFGRDADGNWHGAFAPLNVASPFLPARTDDPVTISFDREVPGGAPDVEFGPPYDTHLIIQDIGVWVNLREETPVFEIGFRIKELEVLIAPRLFRTFGKTSDLFREGIHFTFDLDFAYGIGTGVSLNLSSGLEFLLVLDIGGETFKLHSARFVAELAATENAINWRIKIGLHLSGQIGPLALVVDGIGVWFGSWPATDEIGIPITDNFGFLPPTGAGVSLEIGPIMVGGFLDWGGDDDVERYAGLLYAKFWMLEVIAFGIYEKTENDKTSIIVVLGARFAPGIQLGFGFAITGVGGLLGINRRIDGDALRIRLTSGATGNILFAPDPIKSAPVILGDLGYIFPAAEDVHVGGPTLQISWLRPTKELSLVTFDVGIIFEIAVSPGVYGTTGLTKIVILGTVRCELKVDKFKPIDLRMDIVGLIDLVKDVIEFDATMYDSRIMTVFIIVGDVAFRLSWGDRPYAMLAIGGFHPDFDPEPAMFPDMARLGLGYDVSIGWWFRVEFYFAVTTNTVQMGGKIEGGVQLGPVNAVIWFGLDVLIQFSPFFFTVSISAGARLRWNSTTLVGVRFVGTLSGPGPLRLSGEVCFEVLWFDICKSGSITLGEGSGADPVPAVSSLSQALQSELSEPANIQAVGAEDRLVTAQTQLIEGDCTVISPIGRLQWTQKRIPLNCLVERFEGAPVSSTHAVVASVATGAGSGSAKDWFSPGSFINLSDSEKLNRASFERLDAGLTFGFEIDSAQPVLENLEFRDYVLPHKPVLLLFVVAFPMLVLESSFGRTADVRSFSRRDAAVSVRDEAWSVHTANGAISQTGISQTDAHQRARYNNCTALPDDDMIDLGGI